MDKEEELMKCSSCGFENKENSKFCIKCGNKMPAEEKADLRKTGNEVPENIPGQVQNTVPAGKKPVFIGIAAVAVIGIAAGVIAVNNNTSDNDIAVAESTDSSMAMTAAEIAETAETTAAPVTTAQTSKTAVEAVSETSAAEIGLHNDPSVKDELYSQYEWLSDVSSDKYSLYDVFTNMEAVAQIAADHSYGLLDYEQFLYNCYSYYWSFGDDHGQADDFCFCIYGPGYIEASYSVYVPIYEVAPYLKQTLSHNLLPESNEMYYYYDGNTEGNYANFSAYVSKTECGIPYGVIYCGGEDYTSWKVRSGNFDYSEDRIVVNDLSDMVLYEDGGADYSYIYYRNSGDDCALYRVSTDGSERIKLTDTRASNVRLYGDYIYYSSDKKFWRMNRDGSGKTKIIDAYCYLPSFYKGMIYCISPDDSCLDIYDINGGSVLDHMYLDNRPMHIDNFFIQNGVLIARGYYTDNDEPFVVIISLEDPSITVKYSVECGGINADYYYIYICYDDNGTVRLAKIPLREFTNSEAIWNYELPEMINSYFYVVEYGAHQYCIYQADLEGKWHRFVL
ncbi:MAG: DUF5050 domain-containing protein [Huintestinicola sp.]|uniref:zinc ribbon domain-containing protein n=1 Tax=Huintestinicola sp. TaxID=2981661 RepID=UPI003F11B050